MMEYDIVIVGAGPAGLSAAMYGKRAGKKVLILEKQSYGGQIINTPAVENYPGIPMISGFAFASALYQQVVDLGAEIKYEKVNGIAEEGNFKIIQTDQASYRGRTVILATGARNRPLGLEGEQEWIGAGVSYCAACDGMFYKGKTTAVVGGGNTALEDALILSEYCRKVYLIHRRDTFRGEAVRLHILEEKDQVEILRDSQVTKLHGKERVEGITVIHHKEEKTREISVDGLFVAIGQMPENDAFYNVVKLDFAGYILAGEECRTSTPGIFAAGDCRTKEIRQLTTAAADGTIAALQACSYLYKHFSFL